ncbi:MAG TPA: hypothetical protein VLI04_08120 [Nocardioidaceae bacterium]|nr:hypothetical protein [Nocardioidaceae bacterium]
MNTEVEGWDDWTRPSGWGGLLILAACPVLVVALVIWLVARALGLGTP